LASSLVLNLLLLLGLAALLAIFSPALFSLIGAEFPPEKRGLALQLFLWMLPCVLISGIAVTLGSVLNAEERFFGAAAAPALVPLAILVAVLLMTPSWGVYSLAIGTVAGYVFELILIILLLRRYGIPVVYRWQGFHPALRDVVRQYIPAVSGSSLMCSAILIDQTMSASLGSGNVAALNYGNKLVAVIVGAVTVALGTAVLPFFSAMVAKSEWSNIRRTLKQYITLILATTVPCTLLFMYLSEWLVRLLYQRGAFSAEDTALVSTVQMVLAAQIPFHTLGILFVRLLSSMKLNTFMFVSNIISVVLNVTLNYLFMQYWGIVGIALSTVCVYLGAAVFMGIVVYRHLPREGQSA
jgi:putative peptidoglycan lipid II flippase